MKRLSQWILISAMIFPYSAFAKLVKVGEMKQLTVYGFLVKAGDKAVVRAGQKKYILPWTKFVSANNVAANHETHQTKYLLPFDQDLKVEFEPDAKDLK